MPLEICAFNVESAIVAANAGADRIEFCANASVGGTTPALEDVKIVKSKIGSTPLKIMIRPRGGNFTYTEKEFAEMKASIELLKPFADSFVFGVLDAENKVDVRANKELIACATPRPTAFHRAFDEVPDLMEATDAVISCRFWSILTSGGQPTAVLGGKAIRNIMDRAKARVFVISAGGIRSNNIEELRRVTTGGDWFHSSAITEKGSEMADPEEIKRLSKELAKFLVIWAPTWDAAYYNNVTI